VLSFDATRNSDDQGFFGAERSGSAPTQHEVRVASSAARRPASEQAYRTEKHHEAASTLYDLIELELGARDVSFLALVVRRLEKLRLEVRTA